MPQGKVFCYIWISSSRTWVELKEMGKIPQNQGRMFTPLSHINLLSKVPHGVACCSGRSAGNETETDPQTQQSFVRRVLCPKCIFAINVKRCKKLIATIPIWGEMHWNVSILLQMMKAHSWSSQSHILCRILFCVEPVWDWRLLFLDLLEFLTCSCTVQTDISTHHNLYFLSRPE